MNKNNVILIFLLFASFHTQTCDIKAKGLETCCCEELIQHDGLLVSFVLPDLIEMRNFDSKTSLCADTSKLRGIHPFNAIIPHDTELNKTGFINDLTKDMIQLPRNISFTPILTKRNAKYQYKAPTINFRNESLENNQHCVYKSIEIDYYTKMGVINDMVPVFFEFIEETDDGGDSCRYYYCLINYRGVEGPFCTVSGLYTSKHLLCTAYDEYKDITEAKGCADLPDCDGLSTSKLYVPMNILL